MKHTCPRLETIGDPEFRFYRSMSGRSSEKQKISRARVGSGFPDVDAADAGVSPVGREINEDVQLRVGGNRRREASAVGGETEIAGRRNKKVL